MTVGFLVFAIVCATALDLVDKEMAKVNLINRGMMDLCVMLFSIATYNLWYLTWPETFMPYIEPGVQTFKNASMPFQFFIIFDVMLAGILTGRLVRIFNGAPADGFGPPPEDGYRDDDLGL